MPHFPENEQTDLAVKAPDGDETERLHRVQIKNRRLRYLELHPEYFKQPALELADPLLYDRMVRRFQSADEREKDGRAKGYSGVLEANLLRSEAKLDALHHPDPNSPMVYTRTADGSITGVERDHEERATSRDDGWEKWKEAMGRRFIRGDDEDFEYAAVDDSDAFDDRDEEDRRRLDDYLHDEEEQFLGEGKPVGETGIQDY